MPHRSFPAIAPLTAALALVFAAPTHAAENDAAAAPRKPQDLDKVQVVGKIEKKASSVKYTEPLRDTAQSITVVNREVMEEQNLLGLRDVLTTLPGITFGAGEGGGGYGDSITLRGFNASSDITTDNVRDSAQYSRTDSFNLEAIELVNGANSVHAGAGSVGGNINLVTKAARTGTFNTLQVGTGTDDYGRMTLDSNVDLGGTAAFRVNLMAHRNDAPGRDVENFERWGIAPSIVLGLGTDTRFTLSYFHQTDDNVPQYGVPYYSEFGGPLPGVDPKNYYGYANVDTQEIDVDMLTAMLEHDIGDNTTLRTLARVQQVDQLSIVNPPQGTWCLANGINASTLAPCDTPGTFVPTQPTGPRGNFRDTTNGIAILQADLTTRFDTGAIGHAVVAGASLSDEDFDLDTGNVQRNPDGSTPVLPPMDIANPYNLYNGPINYVRSNITEGSLSNRALYVFDTLKFDENWMLNVGARWEHNEGDTVVDTYGTSGATLGQVTAHTDFDNEEDLFSYRAAVLFKPVEAGTIYLSYSDSRTPSKATVNGACTAQTCSVDPETAVNVELGTKWELSDRLAVSAAVFRNDRDAFKVADPGNPANPSGEEQLDGQARVDGVSLGVAGELLPRWSVFANITVLESEVLQGVSDHVAATTGDILAGRAIAGTPERSGSVWSTYDLERWSFGYGVTYQSGYDWYNARGSNFGYVRGFTTHRAMVSFDATRDLTLQLNANNLFDKQYYTRVRNNGWATPGDARSVVLSATYRF